MAGNSESGYMSAVSLTDSDNDWSPAPSSVDSEELQEMLEELQIMPQRNSRSAAAGKQQLVLGHRDTEAAFSPTSSRPFAPPRLHAAGSNGFAVVAATAVRLVPAAQGTQNSKLEIIDVDKLQQQKTKDEEVEVIEILDSSDSEDEWCMAAPSTAQKRLVVDSDSEEEEEEGRPTSRMSPALLPFFAAIPSLAAPAVALCQQQPQAPSAAPRSRQPMQQHPAPPLPHSSTAAAPAGSGGRPLSAPAFNRQRKEMTAHLFNEFNRTVFGGQLPADLEIKWNARLLTTAGLTHYRREIPDDPYAPPIYTAHVELSSKVLDGFSKLERTLCHELCHVAAWLVDHTAKPPHGPVFKAWANKAMRLYTHLDITTCHAYDIFYPFRWQCTNSGCLQEYGRHSNSIDTAKKVCGACRSSLAFLGRFKPDGTPAKQRAGGSSKFIEFVKDNHAAIRAQLPAGTPQKVVMQHVSAKYAEARQRHQQQQQDESSASSSGGSFRPLRC